MFALQNEILVNWYDSQTERGVSFGPKPSGAAAFPSASDSAGDRWVNPVPPPFSEPADEPPADD